MSHSSAPLIDEIVQQAALLDGQERIAYLQFNCAGNSALYEQALSRLSGIREWSNDESALTDSPDQGLSFYRAGDKVGNYRVVQSIGQGGMGEVLLAERADLQYSQRVAIKLVRSGVLSKQIQGRLKVERQILATLDHANIARLIDGGTTDRGTPYIVMEYIDGLPIDVYCTRHKLSIRQRLELFRTVCSAVHCAHQNLIVHRDLKPSNILVTPDGTPKLLDFGIAKMLDQRQVLHTMAVTQADIRVMTPEHASPEQVRGDVITTASDIYSLGILLYELLTGQRPYAFKSNRLSDIERAICDDPPLPLSAVLSARDGKTPDLAALSAQHSTTLSKLRSELAGDLSGIIAMALRKEPERRYSSVEQFSADVGRYLKDLPIAARPDTWQYRTRKFVERHAVATGFAALSVLALIAFTLTTALQSRRIESERMRAERVSTFLVDMFEQADPSRSLGNKITAREMIDAGAKRITSELRDEPDTRSTLLTTMGQVYGGLGLYDEAIAALQESLATKVALYGLNHPEVASVKKRLGDILILQGNLAAAEPNIEAALTIYRHTYNENSLEVANALASLGELRRNQQRPVEAEELLRKSLAIYTAVAKKGGVQQLDTLNNLAILLVNHGDYAGAERLYRQALEISAKDLGHDHPIVAMTHLNLAALFTKAGKLAEAEPHIEDALAIYRRVLGSDHPNTIDALVIYGDLLRREGHFDKAEQVLIEAIALDQKTRGTAHESIGFDLVNLGLVQHDQHRYTQAEASFRAALDIFAKKLPPNHQLVGWALRSLGITLAAQFRNDDAVTQLRRAIDIYEKSLPEHSPQVLLARAALGHTLAQQGSYPEAELLLTTSLKELNAMMDPTGADLTRVRQWTQQLFVALGKNVEARTLAIDSETRTEH